MELPLLLQIPSLSVMSRNEPPGFENCSARSAQLQFAVLTFFCLPLPWVPQGWGKTRMSQQEISASPLTVPWEIGCLTGLEWSHETISWASCGIYSMFSAHTCVATVQLMFHHFGLFFPEGCYLCSSQGSSRFYFLQQLGCHPLGYLGSIWGAPTFATLLGERGLLSEEWPKMPQLSKQEQNHSVG